MLFTASQILVTSVTADCMGVPAYLVESVVGQTGDGRQRHEQWHSCGNQYM